MASEVLHILNLSPIPELSEMELSTVLEQLSCLSDQNGEITDRNVEDILREAEVLIDTSISIKTESLDSRNYLHLKEDSKQDEDKTDLSVDVESGKSDKELTQTEDIHSSKESSADILKLSSCNDCNSLENEKSDDTLSDKKESDSSEVASVQTARSLTNHIQSTLISLREYSQKLESKKKDSSHNKKEEKCRENPSNVITQSCSIKEQNLGTIKHKTQGSRSNGSSENEKEPSDSVNKSVKEIVTTTKKSDLTDNSVKNQNTFKRLGLNESIRTLDCFERLYRGKPTRGESKRSKLFESVSNEKRTASMRFSKTINPSKCEPCYKLRKVKENVSSVKRKKTKPYALVDFDGDCNCPVENKQNLENVIDEEISFEKCLELLNEESESQNNLVGMTSINYSDLAEKILKECSASVSALQGEVEDIKSQMKKKEANKNELTDSKENVVHQFCSQENIVQILKEENSKLFKEIEEIKEQLKTNVESSTGCRSENKVEVVEKLRLEVENLRRSLITAYSENNGISRLEEQFSLLKRKYDMQIGKLEEENAKLKGVLAGHDPSEEYFQGRQTVRKDVNVQTDGDNERANVMEWKPRKMTRSASMENCRRFPNVSPFVSHSCENVDVATSPIRNVIFHGDRELCSVSVQCEGEFEAPRAEDCQVSIGKRQAFGQFRRLENKENMGWAKMNAGKVRSGLNNTNQTLKQRKLFEHENELMVTVRALHSEITVKDRDNKKLKNELEAARNQIKRLTASLAKYKSDVGKKFFHVGTQTIGLNPKIHEEYDPVMFQVSNELESENEELKSRMVDLEKVIDILKEKRIRDLQILQKLHEEEIDKLASRLNTQTALTNHLHSLLTNR